MAYVLVKRNFDSDDFIKLINEAKNMNCKSSSFNHSKATSNWSECDAIAFSAAEYFSEVVDCLEITHKDITFLSLKYSQLIYKIIDKDLDEELFNKMKSLSDMNKKLRELANAISSLQSAEYDLATCYEEVTGSYSCMDSFEDLSSDDHIGNYSIRNEEVREVFSEFFN